MNTLLQDILATAIGTGEVKEAEKIPPLFNEAEKAEMMSIISLLLTEGPISEIAKGISESKSLFPYMLSLFSSMKRVDSNALRTEEEKARQEKAANNKMPLILDKIQRLAPLTNVNGIIL